MERAPPRRLSFVLLLATLAGCVAAPPPRSAPEPAPPAPRDPGDLQLGIGASVEGRPIRARVLGRGDEVVLLIATIHGNEDAGTPLLRRLGDELRARPRRLAGRTVILVPVANPDGRAARTRGNAHGVDLNRNFPSRNFTGTGAGGGVAPLSEPESRILHDLVAVRRPARVVSIHQPLALIDHDGPGADLADAMAAACGLPARRLGGRPGSMGSWVGLDLGIPIVTVELPRDASGGWDRWGAMLLEAVGPERETGAPRGAPGDRGAR